MARYARIANGLVAEIFTPPDGLDLADCFTADIAEQFVPATDGVKAGMSYADGKFGPAPAPPAPPVAVPASVHAYQFAGQAAAESIITVDEAKAWAGAGTVPASLQAAVDKVVTDPDAHDRVTFFLVGATDFPRYHPNTIALGEVFGKDTPEKLDAFFVAAGQR